jgi:hypothetical protein
MRRRRHTGLPDTRHQLRVGLFLLLFSGIAAASACRREAAGRSNAAAPAPPAAVAEIPELYGLRPAEKRALEGFLGRNPDLRPPTDSDRRVSPSGDGDVRQLYGVYHPYFVRGDLNDDGLLDFVMGFVRRDPAVSTPWFSVVVFTGSEGGASFGQATFLERDITLAAGDISIDRDAILITPDLEEEAIRRYRWDPAGRSYVFVDEEEPEADPPDLSRT